MRNRVPLWPVVLVGVALAVWPEAAFAYIGPGVGLTVIGTFLGFVSAVFLGIVGFLWYPLKRLLRAVRRRAPASRSAKEAAGEVQDEWDRP